MSATAIAPTAVVIEIPGRYSPIYVKNRTSPASVVASTTTNSVDKFLARMEQANADFNVPLTAVQELGTNFNVGEFSDLPDSKLSLSGYDTGLTNLGLLTGTAIPSSATTTIGYAGLANAIVDVTKQYADANGNIFYTEYMDNLFIEEYAISLKAKSASMESFSMVGCNLLGFRGAIQTKAYIIQSADVTSHSFDTASILGASEIVVPVPTPGGSLPASYWQLRGSLTFLKIERYRSGLGWVRFLEVSSGTPTLGHCKNTAGVLSFAAAGGDLVAGDLFYVTYATYVSNVVNYSTIYQTTPDNITSADPIAIPTRLAAITISAGGVSRGQGLDIKMSLKRDRAEGIGDPDALYGPPDAPEVSISLDVKRTDNSLNTLMQTAQTHGTDDGGTVAGDFFDPFAMTNNQLATTVPVVATLSDPRTAGVILKTITCPTSVFTSYNVSDSTKGPITVKYDGKDKVGNATFAVTKA